MSRAYRAWLDLAVPVMRDGMPRHSLPVRVCVTIRGGKGFPVTRDLDNCLKAILDGLRHAGRIPGDTAREVPEVSVRYESPGGPGAVAECVVEVREV